MTANKTSGGVGTNQYGVRGVAVRRDAAQMVMPGYTVAELYPNGGSMPYVPALRGHAGPAGRVKDADNNMRYKSPRTGAWVPSVTTVLRAEAKPGLDRWKTNQLLDLIKDRYQDGTLGELVDPVDGKPWKKQRSEIIAAANEAGGPSAADLGTQAHNYAEAVAARECGYDIEIPSYQPEAAGYVESWKKWRAAHQVRWLGLEVTGYNDTVGYAGTADALAIVDNHLALVDYKSSAKGDEPPDSYSYQLAALAHSEYLVDGAGLQHPMPAIDTATIVQLRPDGFRDITVDTGPGNYRTFRALHHLWHAQQDGNARRRKKR